MWAMTHQTALVLIFGKSLTKLYCALSKAISDASPAMADADAKRSAVPFVEISVSANLPRLLEAIPEPIPNFGPTCQPAVASAASNGRLKAH